MYNCIVVNFKLQKKNSSQKKIHLLGDFIFSKLLVLFCSRDNVFSVSIDLAPGEYLYKYFVDSEWQINKEQVWCSFMTQSFLRFRVRWK